MKYNENNKWESIFCNFSKYFPSMSKECIDWWPGGYEKIVVQFEDGNRVIFDNTTNTYRNVSMLRSNGMPKDKWQAEFRRRLRSAMLDNCCDQEKLSRLVGVSQGTISNYLSGKSIPDLWTAMNICKVLGTPIESFMYFE